MLFFLLFFMTCLASLLLIIFWSLFGPRKHPFSRRRGDRFGIIFATFLEYRFGNAFWSPFGTPWLHFASLWSLFGSIFNPFGTLLDAFWVPAAFLKRVWTDVWQLSLDFQCICAELSKNVPKIVRKNSRRAFLNHLSIILLRAPLLSQGPEQESAVGNWDPLWAASHPRRVSVGSRSASRGTAPNLHFTCFVRILS